MGDEDALLLCIAENPHDDTPLNIYADWLVDNGEDDLADAVREIGPGKLRYLRVKQIRKRDKAIKSVAKMLRDDPLILLRDEKVGDAVVAFT